MDKGTQNWHWVAYERAIESLRRDADDGERDAVEQLLLADDVGIAVEAFFPEPVTDLRLGFGLGGLEREGAAVRTSGSESFIWSPSRSATLVKKNGPGFARCNFRRASAPSGSVFSMGAEVSR
jgi:hypothetical protein